MAAAERARGSGERFGFRCGTGNGLGKRRGGQPALAYKSSLPGAADVQQCDCGAESDHGEEKSRWLFGYPGQCLRTANSVIGAVSLTRPKKGVWNVQGSRIQRLVGLESSRHLFWAGAWCILE